MLLTIDTIRQDGEEILVRLEENGQVIAEYAAEARYSQSEKLLPAIQKILLKADREFSAIKAIRVNNQGGSFTALRIGVATANALAYALDVPVAGSDGQFRKGTVPPQYGQEPNITKPKSKPVQ